ncbi:MAG: alpha/beta fold hydrolase [Bacteroidales bacterium]
MEKIRFLPKNPAMRLVSAILLILLSLTVLGGIPEGDIPAKPYDNSHFAVIDSIRIHYRTWNSDLKNPKGKVLLIHGFCGSTFCWRNNYDALIAAKYEVVAIDLPGFGYSGRNAKLNQSQSNRARLIWALLTKLDGADTTKWNIVGHSMGGGTAEAVALVNPRRTKSLTILDGMIFIENDNVNKRIVGLVNLPFYKKLLLSYTENRYLSFNNFRRELKGTYGFLPDTVTVNGYWQPLQIDGTAETVVNLLANSDEIQHLEARGLDQFPVLVIWGKKDKTIRLKQGKKLKKHVPSIELKVIPDAYHMAMETHPAIFNEMLIDFLERSN